MVFKILLIDSYDSFTNNLASLCRQSIPDCHIHIIKNDQFSLNELLPYIASFSAIVVGPGPGSPACPKDMGVVKGLWTIAEEHLLPIFGVCLGLQSLGIEFGAELKRLNVVKHGQVSHVNHEGIELFKGVGDVDAVRYHSLHIELPLGSELEQLGWCDDGEENGKVLMALKHTSRPFWAVQYHPESICTQGGGSEVIRNFWRLAVNWNNSKGRCTRPWSVSAEKEIGSPWPQTLAKPSPIDNSKDSGTPITVTTSIISMSDMDTPTICERLGVEDESVPFILLDSAARPGRFTIIGALSLSAPRFTYFTGDTYLCVTEGSQTTRYDLGPGDVWSWLAAFMRGKETQGGYAHVPFWGGLVGHLSYELGMESLSVPVPHRRRSGRHPDVNLVFVDRSVVRDSVTGDIYLQSLIPNDDKWFAETKAKLKVDNHPLADDHFATSSSMRKRRKTLTSNLPSVTLPDKKAYIARIKAAKEHLYTGNSYELCVTAPTHIVRDKVISKSSSSWDLYKTLRRRNPAPHSGYIRLHPSTLISGSPERFLSYSRGPNSVCQLRPIKGTLRKGPGVSRAVAEQKLAGNRKEVAENLMIVDLIRHDLHGVVGEDVQVKKFCGVEEAETVWSLVSVIEGMSSSPANTDPSLDSRSNLGWEVLSHSLPPGSMTGAPKKRSVEILQDLEDSDRGIYSGVFGYWCVGGSGDWSVVIRSCFKYDDQYGTAADDALPTISSCRTTVPKDKEEWVIGAGGAITALSDPEAEWEEMVVKLQSALGAFGTNLAVPS